MVHADEPGAALEAPCVPCTGPVCGVGDVRHCPLFCSQRFFHLALDANPLANSYWFTCRPCALPPAPPLPTPYPVCNSHVC
jgi:hypothetical protein